MIRRGILTFAAAFVLLAILPFLRGPLDYPAFYLIFLSTIFFWAAQSTSWNILSGYSGYFSFGQAAFVGVGAYATANLVGRQEWPFLLTLPIGGVLGALLGLAIGGLAFRLRSSRSSSRRPRGSSQPSTAARASSCRPPTYPTSSASTASSI
jgi:branched-chain amino acid transport system permease protein